MQSGVVSQVQPISSEILPTSPLLMQKQVISPPNTISTPFPAAKPPPTWVPSPLQIQHDSLPPLPKIQTAKLHDEAFAHSSTLKLNPNTAHPHYDLRLRSYRRLELVGDGVLQHFVTRNLYELYPDLAVSCLTTLRSHLVGNINLAHLSLAYGLPIHLSPEWNRNSNVSLESQDISADIFEAYVGALEMEKSVTGYDPNIWLQQLFSPNVFVNLTTLADMERVRAQDYADKLAADPLSNRGDKRKAEECVSSEDLRKRKRWQYRPDPSDTECDCANARMPEGSQVYTQVQRPGWGWHAALSWNGKRLSCGNGPSKEAAQRHALSRYLDKAAK